MQESGEYLQQNYPERDMAEIREALEAGKGNIGRCRAYMEQEQYYNSVQLAKNIAAAYTEGSEYGVLKALAAADGKKALLREGIYLFSEIVRDSCALLTNGEVIGCDTRSAEALSRKLTLSAGAELYDKLTYAVRRIDANCSLSLVCNSLCAELF
jgi:DNA polymerase-3 subunit delta'